MGASPGGSPQGDRTGPLISEPWFIPEESTRHGRIDLTLKLPHQNWLFEFQVAEGSPAGSALRQLKDKGDADKYRTLGKPITRIGIAFSEQQ